MTHRTIIAGDLETVLTALCGPAQHDEHCKGWRWQQYMAGMLGDVLRKRGSEREVEPYFRTPRELRDYRAAKQAYLQWGTM